MGYDRAKIKMVGRRFSRLVIVKESKDRNKHGHIMYLCECSCGNKKEILGSSIRSGATTSCGCAQIESATKHGMDGTSTYKVWIGIKSRCNNKSDKRYRDWGGRGISVCDRWLKFDLFLLDMGEKPDGMSIDRIDNDGGYSKLNCRWSTPKEQARNRRNTIIVNHKGVCMFLDEFAKEIGLSESGARKKIYRLYVKNINGVFVKEEDL